VDWRSVLLEINREQLVPPLRPILDDLAADALLSVGSQDRLLDWLLRIPWAECSPRNNRMIETVAMSQLAYLDASRALTPALDLWDKVIRRPWPGGEVFPAQFILRLGALVDARSPSARELYHQRLVEAKKFLFLNLPGSPCVELVDQELKRLEATP
jgi:hypothetical protein